MARTKQFNEQATLEKAMMLFWRNGYYATSVQELVDELGVNRASLYATYGDKRQLFERAFAHYRATNSKALTRFFAEQKSVKTAFRTLFQRAIAEELHQAEQKGCFVVNTIAELLPEDAGMLPSIQENQQFFEELFYHFLLSGQANGELRSDRDWRAVAEMLFMLYSGLKLLAKTQPKEAALQRAVEQALSLLE
ncbi:MAG: helix-turn-helix domain-containing protein [Bacteroidota bacterium]